MAIPFSQIPGETIRELRNRKWTAFLLFSVISFLVLIFGLFAPKSYKSEVVVYVDDRNIIQPLMEGSAVTTEISERTSSAKELLWNSRLMTQVAEDTSIFGPGASELGQLELEQRIATLRQGMYVSARGESYFSIGYKSSKPAEAFLVAQKLGQLFISETNRRKKDESRGAYDFIDKQVKSYERQIAEVEQRLETFLSANTEGTESEADKRMADLRRQLELAQLEKSELTAQIDSLQGQLSGISPTIGAGGSPDAYAARIAEKQNALDDLRLRYHDTYPDIIILKEQISELEKQQAAARASGAPARSFSGDGVANPVYQEVGASLAKARASLQTMDTRINSLQALITEQESRMGRIQENKTEYSELTRDMEVNKQIYDDLLKRRERARVSMHLDIEGQGLSYDVVESAQYPLEASGPGFIVFAAAGLFLGIAAPIGAIVGLLQVDPRIRHRDQLEKGLGMPVLVDIPEVRTPVEKRRDRWLTFMVASCALIVLLAYIGISAAALLGVI